ncbi:MAG TPA: allophanate hydrolase subunit 1 [Propionicimonas sp.]|jgi:KipI family sensor histidine kinase inhibitor|uniref:5-oxoprolinase subunit B family protein n=1 Tax=Propionicimonas sp. TaxID=1955623 RepID=UPI002F3FCEF9
MRILPCGQTALLLECAPEQVAALHAALVASGLPLTDVVPAARTVLVRCDAAVLGAVREHLEAVLAAPLPPAPTPAAGTVVTIDVRYDGPDLARVAALTGLDAGQVVAAHTGTPWRVAFGGFAPGFAYLDGGDARLAVPRLETPRTEVPAGSVGLADGFSGIYPRSSPGGWQLIGSTTAILWDAGREPPALLRPGWWVQFVAVDR